jgi:hypothetical protein
VEEEGSGVKISDETKAELRRLHAEAARLSQECQDNPPSLAPWAELTQVQALLDGLCRHHIIHILDALAAAETGRDGLRAALLPVQRSAYSAGYEAVAQWLRDNDNGPWPGSSESYLAQADEIIAAYEQAAPKLAPKVLALAEKTIPELQAELGRIQAALHVKVLGDPRERVTIGTVDYSPLPAPPKDPAP